GDMLCHTRRAFLRFSRDAFLWRAVAIVGLLRLSDAFEILDLSLVLLGRLSRLEGAEIAAPPRLGILLSRLETVLAGFKLSNHCGCTSRCPLIKTCRTEKFRDAPSDFTALAGARYDRFGRALRVSPMAAAMSASSFDVPPLLPA